MANLMDSNMTQEQKELLLKDLCARLPYGVICKDTNINITGTLSQIGLHYDVCTLDKDDGDSEACYIFNCKPYLFPLSSMTEEQEIEFLNTCVSQNPLCWTLDTFKWLNKNHFDYNYLIDDDLAIDATGLNIY